MATDPHRMVMPWAWGVGMNHGGARNEGEKDKKDKAYLDEGCSHGRLPPIA